MQNRTTLIEKDKMEPMTECPRCGAKNAAEARTRCKPGKDECPTACAEDFGDALTLLTQMNEVLEQPAEESMQRERKREMECGLRNNPTDGMLHDARLK